MIVQEEIGKEENRWGEHKGGRDDRNKREINT